jgi:hypothetical protein
MMVGRLPFFDKDHEKLFQQIVYEEVLSRATNVNNIASTVHLLEVSMFTNILVLVSAVLIMSITNEFNWFPNAYVFKLCDEYNW